ncbi:MAG: glycosyltransferase [Clostridiales bacterium]|nr:glycosyltransferase [Roseburia sp.]MDD7638496.1 glycosyltransferase [Clostridiales bacterium]
MQLSVCIITKNEQQNIARCLESLKPYDVEIVVVDTGSTDNTKQIAVGYTDNLYDFVWCDDFAAAKNFAVSKTAKPYVLVLDSDEYIEEFDILTLEQLLQEHPEKVGRIKRRNIFSRDGIRKENQEWINRIFAKDSFCYEGRIHEQVVAKDGTEYDTYRTPIVIGHTGYDLSEEERKKKTRRNIALLEQELARLLEENGVSCVREDLEKFGNEGKRGEQIPYILYQLGKSYYMAEDYVQACEYFSQGLSYDLNSKLEYVIDMVETYGYALINSGNAGEALFFENIYEEFGDGADFQFLMGLIYMNNARFDEAIEQFQKAATHKECRNQGVNSYAAYYNIGVICECLGKMDEARVYYKMCKDYEPARRRLSNIGK